MASNGGIIPTPQFVGVLNGDFNPLMEILSHMVDVSRAIHNPDYKSIMGHCAWMLVKQMGQEIREAGQNADWPMRAEIWNDAEIVSGQADAVMKMVTQ